MSFRVTATQSSRVKKSTKKSLPFASLPPRKPSTTQPSKNEEEEEDLFEDRLDDVGLVQALAKDMNLRDVAQAILYMRNKMWSEIPEQRTGMNSTRIAEILNFRSSLPPIVTVSHIQALLNSPTMVEREVAELVQGGTMRKMVVDGRGSLGEVLILIKDLDNMVRESKLEPRLMDSFIDLLHKHPNALKIPRSWLSEDDAKALMHAGFLTSSTPTWTTTDLFSRPGDGSRGTSISIHSISRAASGSLAAVGGEGAIHASGGSGGGARHLGSGELSVTLPGIGSMLKLLANARTHLTSLLSRSKTREAPEGLLRDRWNGNAASNSLTTMAKRNRGEFAGVAPGKTRKWREFNGLTFETCLQHAVGAGLVEVFDTGNSVGRGVRALQSR